MMQAAGLKAEIVAIGTELLLGQILNTNAQYLSAQLAQIGIGCYWHTTVGDNKERIKECLRLALSRADVIITTGGLGPTADDLTIECVAELFGSDMVFDQPTMERIEDLFRSRGLTMPETNRKQAMRPSGSDILPNHWGSAPGIIWSVSESLLAKAGVRKPDGGSMILSFPGVPYEMTAMWNETARPFLIAQAGGGTIWSCELKHFGIGESALAEMYGQLLDSENPTVAPLAGRGECRLRVTARAANVEKAIAIAQPTIDLIRTKSGLLCYGTDEDTLEASVGRLLAEKKMTVAVAESCTGGLVSKLLTDVPGSSSYIKLNVVAYADDAKHELLAVHKYVLETKGAVSPECAHAMATGVRRLAGADIGLSITGIAGPGGGTAEKPVGLVHLALVAAHFQADKTLRLSSHITRGEIRARTAKEALNMVRIFLIDPTKLR